MGNPPSHWKRINDCVYPEREYSEVFTVAAWVHKSLGITVRRSKAHMMNGDVWLHLAVSSWLNLVEIQKIKEEFLGLSTDVFFSIPKREYWDERRDQYIHIWSPISLGIQLPGMNELRSESPA